MDEETVTNIFAKLLTTMNQHFYELSASLHEKLNTTILSVESRYKAELDSRDKIISELIQKNEEISKERNELKEKLKTIKTMSHVHQNPFENENLPVWNEVGHAPIEPQPNEKLDLLVIGDSIVSHLDVDRLNPRGNNKLICKRGGKIEDIRDALMEETSSTKGMSHCIIHVGLNHAPEDPPHLLSAKLLSFLKEVRSNLPETSIHFSSILPKYGTEMLSGINFVNETVKRHRNLIGYSFIDHPDFAWNTSLICKDGVHPSYKGVAQLAMDIKN